MDNNPNNNEQTKERPNQQEEQTLVLVDQYKVALEKAVKYVNDIYQTRRLYCQPVSLTD